MLAGATSGQAQLTAWAQGGQPPLASTLTPLQLPVLEESIPPKLLSE